MSDTLTTALALHQAGQLAQAAQLYERVLQAQPANADALHLFGVLHHQLGQPARAAELITQAIAICPTDPPFHANLAEVYRSVGQFERAADCCRTALRLSPNYPEAACNLGLALQALGRHGEAALAFREALRLQPTFANAHTNLGISLREQGQDAEALAHFRRAVELEPSHAQARTNLGLMLLHQGQPEEALPHCQVAVRLQPHLAPLHHNLGTVLKELGKPAESRLAYQEALRLAPQLALTHAHVGLTFQQEGDLESALAWLKKAVELAPANARLWEHLGAAYEEKDDPAGAIPCWQRVLALEPSHGVAHVALGWALQEEGRLTEALEHYQTAAAPPLNLAAAHMSLGSLHEEQGDLTRAEACYRTALRLQPDFAMPHARLATLLRGKLPDADLAALQERLADPQLALPYRGRLLFGLAHVLDGRGDYQRAAECLRKANALTLSLAGQRRTLSPADFDRFVEGILEAFGPGFFRRTAGGGLDTRLPVFVFGLPRSGTTLIEQVLAAHPKVHGAGELRLSRQAFAAIPGGLGRSEPPLDCLSHLDAPSVRSLAEEHHKWLRQYGGAHAERVIDKKPDNYLYLGLLAAMYPHATFIHCRRDMRDVAVSCWMTDFRSIYWANHPEHIAGHFRQYRLLMDHWRRVLPVALHEVDYEETVADLEGVARRLVAACGLEWDPGCLEFHTLKRSVRTASITQVRQPVYKHAVARWKNYQHHLADLFAALANME
jgi:tetratricopeptide (TPR) repeat protein